MISRKGRFRLAFSIAAPVAALVAAFAASAVPASANQIGNQCTARFVCFYANTNLSPTSSILNINMNTSNWADIDDSGDVCGGIVTHTWNDCASSVDSKFVSANLWAWTNASCEGNKLEVTPGEIIRDLATTSSGNFNDVISSDRINNSGAGC